MKIKEISSRIEYAIRQGALISTEKDRENVENIIEELSKIGLLLDKDIKYLNDYFKPIATCSS